MRYFHPTPPLLCRRSPAPFTAKASALALACALALGGCATEPGTGTPPAQPPAAPAAPAVPPSAQAVPATPAAADGHEEGFVQWRNAFVAQALAEGIRPDTVRNVLAQAQWQPRVIELDRSQPEFTRTPWAYLDSAVSPLRVSQGLAKLEQHSTPLQAAAERYGVPASVVTAIWGIESNYGSNFGTFKTVDALATLAYEGRRHDWARSQLLAALRIIDRGDIAAEAMIGSWAGAMGHTQFIPTVFQAYAVDADGDGRRDIWGSIPDVAASTAHFLVREGWVPGETWGTEVQLPPGFDHARAELSVRQSTAQWAAEGVRSMDGNALPDLASASILAPAGARGPAFLVGKNFRTILRYNNSTNYALAVALLSQRLSGGPGVVADWPRDLQPLPREQTRQLQTALNAKGFDTGTPDGVLGPATRAGLRKYQQSQGLVADGYPTLELLRSLAPAGANP